jgi:hypothetical protein
MALLQIARIEVSIGDAGAAIAVLNEAARALSLTNDLHGNWMLLHETSRYAILVGAFDEAAVLFVGSERLRAEAGMVLPIPVREEYDGEIDGLRARLGAAWEPLTTRGAAMCEDELLVQVRKFLMERSRADASG